MGRARPVPHLCDYTTMYRFSSNAKVTCRAPFCGVRVDASAPSILRRPVSGHAYTRRRAPSGSSSSLPPVPLTSSASPTVATAAAGEASWRDIKCLPCLHVRGRPEPRLVRVHRKYGFPRGVAARASDKERESHRRLGDVGRQVSASPTRAGSARASSGSSSSKVRLPSWGRRPCLLQGARVSPPPRPLPGRHRDVQCLPRLHTRGRPEPRRVRVHRKYGFPRGVAARASDKERESHRRATAATKPRSSGKARRRASPPPPTHPGQQLCPLVIWGSGCVPWQAHPFMQGRRIKERGAETGKRVRSRAPGTLPSYSSGPSTTANRGSGEPVHLHLHSTSSTSPSTHTRSASLAIATATAGETSGSKVPAPPTRAGSARASSGSSSSKVRLPSLGCRPRPG